MGLSPTIEVVQSFTEIVETWGRKEMAADLNLSNKDMPRQWSRDDSITAKHWKRLLEKAPERNISISPDLLIDLAARN